MGSSKIVFIDLRKTLLKLVVALLSITLYFSFKWWNEPYLLVMNCPEYVSSYQVDNPNYVQRFYLMATESPITRNGHVQGKFRITVTSRRQSQTLTFDNPRLVYHNERKKYIRPSKELQRELGSIISELKKRSPFGDLIQWEQVNKLFPLGTTALARDFDTGKTFRLIRKAGYSLARVAPADKIDESVIKEVFGGKWTWKRRAVVIYIGDTRAAACLTGIPQEKEGLFSLCFPDDHLNKSLNFANKLIIYKAAGKVDDLFRNRSPEESILGALTAIDQLDNTTLNMFLTKSVDHQTIKESSIIGLTIRNLHVIKKETRGNSKFKVLVSVSFSSGPYNHWRSAEIETIYNPKLGFHQLKPAFLKTLLDR